MSDFVRVARRQPRDLAALWRWRRLHLSLPSPRSLERERERKRMRVSISKLLVNLRGPNGEAVANYAPVLADFAIYTGSF